MLHYVSFNSLRDEVTQRFNYSFFFFLMIGRPPRSPLFPYPPLSRSAGCGPPRMPSRLPGWSRRAGGRVLADRKSTRLNSSHLGISYAVFCLKKKKNKIVAFELACILVATHSFAATCGNRLLTLFVAL